MLRWQDGEKGEIEGMLCPDNDESTEMSTVVDDEVLPALTSMIGDGG